MAREERADDPAAVSSVGDRDHRTAFGTASTA